MSVKNRLDDARVLYQHGRREGALLMVLVAVAATSRKRYPQDRMTDRQAFEKFLGEQMQTITGGVKNFFVEFRGKMVRLENLLYKFARCKLLHEAGLPRDVVFQPSDSLCVEVAKERITFSDRLIGGLANAVEQAPENEYLSSGGQTRAL